LGLFPGSDDGGIAANNLPKMPNESDLQKMLPIDLLCQFLSHKLQYGPNERDMVLLSHELRIETGTGAQQILKSELIARGDEENSAMAKTVGSPIGIGALVVLKHSTQIPKGIVRPVEQAVWETVLNRLETDCQLQMVEKQFTLSEARAQIGGGLEHVLKSAIKRW
jgi:saccharopine dehydrogenase-like NADP-dependent oxidoreductase